MTFRGGGEHGYESPSPECLKLNVTAKEKRHSHLQRKLAKQDALWNKDTGLLHIAPERDDVEKATHYNFKVKCRINTDSYVVAEIDTDSHLNPLTPKTEKCSDWTENLTTYSSRYSKNFSFYPFIFYLALLKSYRIKLVFNFQTFLIALFYDFFF
jgi:hypothetical protein